MRISINTARVCRQMALPSARLWSTSCCCYSWHHPFSRPAAEPPQQNLHNRTDAVRLTFCHNSLRRLTDNRRALHQAGGEPWQFWRLVRKCCSEPASLFSSGVATCLGASGRTTTSRPGGEISARHATRPRELIRPCDTLSLPSHWPADHVTGCDWLRVTSDQLHQIWPGCCSWGQQQHYALHFYSTQNPLKESAACRGCHIIY